MIFNNRHYPKFFPKGCPPAQAEQKKVKVYRLVEKENITQKDFKSYVELGNKFNPTRNPKYGEYALSVNTNYDELCNSVKSVPYLKKRFKYIATGQTYICTGVVCHDKSKNQPSHHDWWLYEEALPHKYFKIVSKTGGDLP
ncbi:hypothetical protein [Clostridium tyrobutyricum]|uniref:hypothetical protein n=1 Tax=Clostridium tyrobutyricum TaxID=1519 RepID=UPI001C38C575|nr:hypothetical protein [Clostridium tyrobutyricum]MBV4422385.1 hypothetical protein [Clostridium tyrobutyricum]